MKKTFIVLAASFALASCATNNEQSGVLLGAIAGGVIGNQIGSGSGRALATGIGAIVGGMVGGNIGRQMDRNDQAKVLTTLEHNPTGQSSTWRNPDSGHTYSVEPTRTYTNRGSQPCREYSTTAWIGGKKEQVYGTACRQQDGSWKTQ